MLAQAEVPPELTRGLLGRLSAFIEPYAEALREPEQRQHAAEYMTGLISGLERKTGEAIAYLHDQERQGLQKFIGHVPWAQGPLWATLAGEVGAELGEPDGVIVFDPSGFPKNGAKSVGVAGRGAAGSGRSRIVRSASTCVMSRERVTRSSTRGSNFPRNGPKLALVARERVCPKGLGSEPAKSWPWRCWKRVGDSCRTPGLLATTRWADHRVVARNCGREASVTCWGCRRTHWSATSMGRRRNTRGMGAAPRARSCGWTAGRTPCRNMTGLSLMFEMARKDRW